MTCQSKKHDDLRTSQSGERYQIYALLKAGLRGPQQAHRLAELGAKILAPPGEDACKWSLAKKLLRNKWSPEQIASHAWLRELSGDEMTIRKFSNLTQVSLGEKLSTTGEPNKLKCVLFANTDWYLYNFRRSLAATLREKGHEVLLVSPPGPYGQRLQSLGFRWIQAPMDRTSLNPLKELILLRWLWQLLRKEQPDVVHGFTIKCAVYGALVGRLVDAGRVNAVAGMGYVFISDSIRAQLLRPFVRVLLRAALGGRKARLILQNPDDVSFFEEARIVRRDRIRLLRGSGVDFSRFLPPEAKDANELLHVVLAARMLWDKGVAEFVEAARLTKSQGRKVRFLLAGDPDPGNPAAIPEKTLVEWQAEGAVEWLGHVADMPTLLANADIVVLPSYREGLPKSLIEAAACARPLVTTDVPGCREVVTDGVDGLLVPARNAEALAGAIARLQDDPALAKRLGETARAKALAVFDERVIIAQTLAVYNEVAH